MKKRSPRANQRGFGLFVVVLVMAAVSVVGLSMLDVIKLDILIAGHERHAAEARMVAEAGLGEALNDARLVQALPMLEDEDLTEVFEADASSPFADHAAGEDYQVTGRLLRVVPLAESSNTFSRVVVHEVTVRGTSHDGDASHQVAAEVYRSVAMRPGLVIPRRHAR